MLQGDEDGRRREVKKHKEQDYVGSPEFEANDRLRLKAPQNGTNLSFKFWGLEGVLEFFYGGFNQ